MSCSAQKFLAAGHIGSFQIHPRELGKRRRRALAPVIFDLKQQPGHGREVRRLIDALKRCRKIKTKLRVVRFRELLIVRGQNVNAGGMDGDTLVVDKGQIVQRGTHEALMAQGGIYRRFITGREQAVGWKL